MCVALAGNIHRLLCRYHTELVGSQLKPRFPAPQTIRRKRPSAITPGLKAALKAKLAEEEARPKGSRTQTNNA